MLTLVLIAIESCQKISDGTIPEKKVFNTLVPQIIARRSSGKLCNCDCEFNQVKLCFFHVKISSTLPIRKGQITNDYFQPDPNFDLNNYYIPSRSNRNSITETNFVGLGIRVKPAHRDSYASLD